MEHVKIALKKGYKIICNLIFFILSSYIYLGVLFMKVIFIKKSILFSFIIILLTILGLSIFILNNHETITTSLSKPISENTTIDINADGIKDDLEITNNSITLSVNDKTFNLSSYFKNHTLSSTPSSWPVKSYVMKLSRSLSPELVIQSNNNKTSTISIFQYENNNLKKIYSEDKNIFGVLNLNNTVTPTCYSVNSSIGNSSLKSFMINNKEIIDTTKYYKDIPGLNNILTFIDLVQKDYEIDDTPDIFSEEIDSKELGILWNLSKENYTYSFQDAFFTNDFTDNDGNITSLIWRITFEKYNKGSDDNSKKEIIFYLTSELDYTETFRISSISINK